MNLLSIIILNLLDIPTKIECGMIKISNGTLTIVKGIKRNILHS